MSHKRNILTVLLLSAAPAMACPDRTARHDPPDDSKVAPALKDLRNDLFSAGRARVHADMNRFRALCDQEGYPLVGNVATKGERYQPSAYCAEVRTAVQAAPKKVSHT